MTGGMDWVFVCERRRGATSPVLPLLLILGSLQFAKLMLAQQTVSAVHLTHLCPAMRVALPLHFSVRARSPASTWRWLISPRQYQDLTERYSKGQRPPPILSMGRVYCFSTSVSMQHRCIRLGRYQWSPGVKHLQRRSCCHDRGALSWTYARRFERADALHTILLC